MRNGDFSELLTPAVSGLKNPVIIYNPATGQPFAGNIIPANLIDPVGKVDALFVGGGADARHRHESQQRPVADEDRDQCSQ